MSKKIKEIFAKKLLGKNITAQEEQEIQKISRDTAEMEGVIPDLIMEDIIITARQKFNLKNYVNNVFVESEKGTAFFSEETTEKLEIFGTETEDPIIAEDLENLKKIRWDLQKFGRIFNLRSSILKNPSKNYEYLLNRIANILVNTENEIIYNKILEMPRTEIIVNPAFKNDLKEFFKGSDDNNSENYVYMNLNLLDELSTMTTSSGGRMIFDNPLEPNQKMICGKPIVVIPNGVFKSLDKETDIRNILVYGELSRAIALFEEEEKAVLSSAETAVGFMNNILQTRVVARYFAEMINEKSIKVAEVLSPTSTVEKI
ncbi:MAG: phage major capsid protein [Fusobacteriaceae bacterium]